MGCFIPRTGIKSIRFDTNMKNLTMIPLFAVTAAAAFGLGWTVRPDAGDAGKAADAGQSARSLSSDSGRSAGGGARGGASDNSPERQFISRFLVDGKISPEDMKKAIKEMSDTNDPLLRQKMLAALLENLTSENAKDAFLALQENRRGGGPMGRGNDEELRLLANAWGRIDGAGAVAALKEIAEARKEAGEDTGGRGGRGGRGGPGGMVSEMAGALAGWATVDGAGATAYINGIEDEREQRFAAFGVLQGMLVNGVDEAMGFIQGMPAGEEGDRAKGFYMSMIASEMLEQGLDSAKSWVDSVKDPELKAGALARVAMESMGNDPEGTAAWLTQYGSDDSSSFAVARVAESWAEKDPQAVLQWADDLSGASKTEAYQQAMESWGGQDPAAAGEYLATLPASPERDAAVEGYATRVSRDDPSAAMEWAGTIANEDTRQETMVDVARDWYRSDKAAAAEWIEGSGLTEEAVKTITEPPRDWGGRRGR